jgi:hypothetical protein
MVRPFPLVARLICLFTAFHTWASWPSSNVEAAIVFNEATDGDLSNDQTNPTAIGPLALGTTTIVAKTDIDGPDIFSVEVVAGTFLTGLFLENYENPSRPDDRNMFLAVDDSDTFPNDYFEINTPGFFDTSTWLAGSVIGLTDVTNGTNILNRLAASGTTLFIGTGFTAPLGAGTYTFYAQQTRGLNDYTLSFVTAVPEPTTTAGMFGGMIVMGVRQYRKNRKKALTATAAV